MKSLVRFVLISFVLVVCAPPLRGADQNPLHFEQCRAGDARGPFVLILDLRKDVTSEKRPAIFLRAPDDAAVLARFDALLAQCPSLETSDTEQFFTEAVQVKSVDRIVDTKGALINVFAFHQGDLAEVKVEEATRQLKIVSDLGELYDLWKRVRKQNAGSTAAAKVDVARADYPLSEVRAVVRFFVIPMPEPNGPDKPAKPKDPVKVAELTTGPAEHFSISANLPVNSVKEVQYKDGGLVTKETPKEFLAGFDAYLGDVLSDDMKWYDYRRLGAKALIRFSKEPLDTLGVVGAYRWNGFSLIAGPIWTRQAKTATGSTSDQPKHYKMAWRLGLGFDLKTAKSWFDSGAKK